MTDGPFLLAGRRNWSAGLRLIQAKSSEDDATEYTQRFFKVAGEGREIRQIFEPVEGAARAHASQVSGHAYKHA